MKKKRSNVNSISKKGSICHLNNSARLKTKNTASRGRFYFTFDVSSLPKSDQAEINKIFWNI